MTSPVAAIPAAASAAVRQLAHLPHGVGQLGRRFGLLAVAGGGLGSEVGGHGVRAAFVKGVHGAEDVGAEVTPDLWISVLQLTSPIRVRHLSLHHLDEAGLVGISLEIAVDLDAVGEGHLTVEQLRGLRPPRALFWAVAVPAGVLFRVEPDQRDHAAVVGHPGG
jgi:hypothetical protein